MEYNNMIYIMDKTTLAEITSEIPVIEDDFAGIINLEGFSVKRYLVLPSFKKELDILELTYLYSDKKPYRIIVMPSDKAALLLFKLEYGG
jgi:hypothetical protein